MWVQGHFTLTPRPRHCVDEASPHKCPCLLHSELWVCSISLPHDRSSWVQPWTLYYQQWFCNHATHMTRGPSRSSEVYLRVSLAGDTSTEKSLSPSSQSEFLLPEKSALFLQNPEVRIPLPPPTCSAQAQGPLPDTLAPFQLLRQPTTAMAGIEKQITSRVRKTVFWGSEEMVSE